MTITDAQRQALRMLAQHECYTAPTTSGAHNISGAVAKTLVQRGLAIYTRGWQIGVPGFTRVQITDAGRAAIEGIHTP